MMGDLVDTWYRYSEEVLRRWPWCWRHRIHLAAPLIVVIVVLAAALYPSGIDGAALPDRDWIRSITSRVFATFASIWAVSLLGIHSGRSSQHRVARAFDVPVVACLLTLWMSVPIVLLGILDHRIRRAIPREELVAAGTVLACCDSLTWGQQGGEDPLGPWVGDKLVLGWEEVAANNRASSPFIQNVDAVQKQVGESREVVLRACLGRAGTFNADWDWTPILIDRLSRNVRGVSPDLACRAISRLAGEKLGLVQICRELSAGLWRRAGSPPAWLERLRRNNTSASAAYGYPLDQSLAARSRAEGWYRFSLTAAICMLFPGLGYLIQHFGMIRVLSQIALVAVGLGGFSYIITILGVSESEKLVPWALVLVGCVCFVVTVQQRFHHRVGVFHQACLVLTMTLGPFAGLALGAMIVGANKPIEPGAAELALAWYMLMGVVLYGVVVAPLLHYLSEPCRLWPH